MVLKIGTNAIFFERIITTYSKVIDGNQCKGTYVYMYDRIGLLQRQVDNSQKRIRPLRNVRKIRWLNDVHSSESISNVKEVKALMEGLSRARHVYNYFEHDSYLDQVKSINMMRKHLAYNFYSNTYNPGQRDYPNNLWS